MRTLVLTFSMGSALLLAACDQPATDGEVVEVPITQADPVATATTAAPADDYGATPMDERVAVLGLLNKRNNVAEEIELKPGESREVGPVIVRVSACERTAPWEMPQQTGAFVQVDIRGRGEAQHRRVFSGWMFVESPSLNVVEHPIYDVWVKDCTMRFPGEEGSAAAAPTPSGTPAARPSAAPTAAPEAVAAADPAPDA